MGHGTDGLSLSLCLSVSLSLFAWASGIGLELLQRLAVAQAAQTPPWHYVLVVRSRSKGEAVVRALQAQQPGTRASLFLADLGQPADVARAAAEISARYGRRLSYACLAPVSHSSLTWERGRGRGRQVSAHRGALCQRRLDACDAP
jgi:NAD(P)-dependent dehydrogenase (short-subunit alcohol dehydrogenase family)